MKNFEIERHKIALANRGFAGGVPASRVRDGRFFLSGKMSGFVYSKYYSELQDEAAKKRYNEKLKFIGCSKDPFWLLECKTRMVSPQSLEWHQWPDVSYPDVYNYLIETTSEYTHEQLKTYKSLEGYNYLANGWINSISVIKSDGKANYFIFTASVKHSQSLSATPLKVWASIKSDGTILCAHCTRMAGLGEVCSHVAAVLFAAYENTKVKEQHSSTSLPCSWLPPSFRSVEYAPICNIDSLLLSIKGNCLLMVMKGL